MHQAEGSCILPADDFHAFSPGPTAAFVLHPVRLAHVRSLRQCSAGPCVYLPSGTLMRSQARSAMCRAKRAWSQTTNLLAATPLPEPWSQEAPSLSWAVIVQGLAMLCMAADPEQRPTAKAIVRALGRLASPNEFQVCLLSLALHHATAVFVDSGRS